MKSRIELDIDVPQARLAALFANARNNPEWMHDIQRIEPLRGEPGHEHSVYRLVPKRGGRTFVARVVKRTLPTEVRLLLTAPRISVFATDVFRKVSEQRTRLISEEVFTFKGLLRKAIGLLARRAIARAHRRHMESFKRFAETHA